MIVFDPSLGWYNGHHFEFARSLMDGFGSTYDVNLYINYQAVTRLVIELRALPTCHLDIYYPVGEFDANYNRYTRSTVDSLATIQPEHLGAETIMIIHTATVYQLIGLVEWLSNLSVELRPKLLLQFQAPLEYRFMAGSDSVRAIAAARDAAITLASVGKVRFASNSYSLADRISKQIDQPCAVMPLPIRWPLLDRPLLPDPGVVFGFFGALRPEKGASMLAKAIPKFAARHPDVRFIVQAPMAESDPSDVRALEGVPQVELIRNNFRNKAAYFATFCRAHCILLPYDPHMYALRTSGILLEALGLGRLVITTKGTWLHATSLQWGDAPIVMPEYEEEHLLRSMSAARDILVREPFVPRINKELILQNCGSAFCSAVISLIDD
jgi:glycosyltransferase involved in cell wall biosynthesis